MIDRNKTKKNSHIYDKFCHIETFLDVLDFFKGVFNGFGMFLNFFGNVAESFDVWGKFGRLGHLVTHRDV